MTVLKGITPTPAEVKSAYKEAFGPAIEQAAGKDGRLSQREAERMAEREDAGQLVADNLQSFFDRTGQKSVSAQKVIGVLSAIAESETEKHAGPNQRLSLLELRNLPADLVADIEHLRGKDSLSPVTPELPRVAFNEVDMHDFLYPEVGEGWKPSRTVDEGTVTHDGVKAIVTGLNDVGEWQGIAEHAITGLWDNLFIHRINNGEARIGANDNGNLQMGPVINEATGEAGVLVYWRDIDDARHAWFYAQDGNGDWQVKGDVYLN